MSQTNPSQDSPEPKSPSLMLVQEALTFREAISILTPRWIKSLVRRHRSS